MRELGHRAGAGLKARVDQEDEIDMVANAASKTNAGIATLLGDLRFERRVRDARCLATSDKLDLYVSDEIDGVDVRSRHPSTWEHLRDCASCRREYDTLLELLTAEMTSGLPVLPIDSAVIPANESMLEPWRVTIRSTSSVSDGNLVFVFSPSYLEQSLHPATRAASSFRGSGQPNQGSILLASFDSDTPLGEVIVDVEAFPVPGHDSERMLHITAQAERAVATGELQWGERTWRGTFDSAGVLSLGPVALDALTEYGPERFRLDIAFES